MSDKSLDLAIPLFFIIFIVFAGFVFLNFQVGFNSDFTDTKTIVVNDSKVYNDVLEVEVTKVNTTNNTVSFVVKDLSDYDLVTVTKQNQSETVSVNLNSNTVNVTPNNIQTNKADMTLEFSRDYGMSDQGKFVYANLPVIILSIIFSVSYIFYGVTKDL